MYNSKEKCKEIAQKFKQICEDRGTTPYKIAKKAGLSSSTVSGFLNGRTNPRIDVNAPYPVPFLSFEKLR